MSHKMLKVVCKLRDDRDLGQATDAAAIWREIFKNPGMAEKYPGIAIGRLFEGATPAELEEFTSAGRESPELMRVAAAEGSGGRLPHLDSYVLVKLPDTADVRSLLHDLRGMKDIVEFAYQDGECEPCCAFPPATIQRIVEQQKYLNRAKGGIDIMSAWIAGGDGNGVNFADVEKDWSLEHADLSAKAVEELTEPKVTRNGSTSVFASHGTQVLQVVLAAANAIDIKGIAHNVAKAFVASVVNNHPTTAIVKATNRLRREGGGVLLIELQMEGAGSLPLEALRAEFEVIRGAALPSRSPVIVVQCAGNGGVNLDSVPSDPDEGRRSLRRSTANEDSGAIMVGAARSGVTHRRFSQSNFGTRVDCYAWGENVTSSQTGFGATSSAGAIIAGVCCAVQSVHKQRHNRLLTSVEMRKLLTDFPLRRRRRPPPQPEDDLVGVMPDLQQIISHI